MILTAKVGREQTPKGVCALNIATSRFSGLRSIRPPNSLSDHWTHWDRAYELECIGGSWRRGGYGRHLEVSVVSVNSDALLTLDWRSMAAETERIWPSVHYEFMQDYIAGETPGRGSMGGGGRLRRRCHIIHVRRSLLVQGGCKCKNICVSRLWRP